MQRIEYYRKNVWGSELMYLACPHTAKLVKTLTGKETVNARDLDSLRALTGKEIGEVLAPKKRDEFTQQKTGIVWLYPGGDIDNEK